MVKKKLSRHCNRLVQATNPIYRPRQPLVRSFCWYLSFLFFQHVGNDVRAKATGFGAFLVIPPARAADRAFGQPGRQVKIFIVVNDLVDDAALTVAPLAATGGYAFVAEAKAAFGITLFVYFLNEIVVDGHRCGNIADGTIAIDDAEQDGSFFAGGTGTTFICCFHPCKFCVSGRMDCLVLTGEAVMPGNTGWVGLKLLCLEGGFVLEQLFCCCKFLQPDAEPFGIYFELGANDALLPYLGDMAGHNGIDLFLERGRSGLAELDVVKANLELGLCSHLH